MHNNIQKKENSIKYTVLLKWNVPENTNWTWPINASFNLSRRKKDFEVSVLFTSCWNEIYLRDVHENEHICHTIWEFISERDEVPNCSMLC